MHETDAGGDFVSTEALIQMAATLGDEDRLTIVSAKNEASSMSGHRGGAEAGHVGIGHFAFDSE